jgi:hypothetical protein
LDASIAVAVDYNSSHIQLLLDNESVTVIWISDWSLVSQILDIYSLEFTTSRIHCFLWLISDPHRRHHVEQLIALCCPIGCHGNIIFRNLLLGNDSFAAVLCKGNVISGPLLSNGRLALAPLFRLSTIISQYHNNRRSRYKSLFVWDFYLHHIWLALK